MRFDWSVQDARLRGMWLEGKSAREIAEALTILTGQSINREMVIGRVHRLDLPRRSYTDGRKTKASGHRLEAARTRAARDREPASDEGIGIHELTRRTCRWPLNDPGFRQEQRYCGHRCGVDEPYCGDHQKQSGQGRWPDPTEDNPWKTRRTKEAA